MNISYLPYYYHVVKSAINKNKTNSIKYSIIIDPLNYIVTYIGANWGDVDIKEVELKWEEYKKEYYSLKGSNTITIDLFKFFENEQYKCEVVKKLKLKEDMNWNIPPIFLYDSPSKTEPIINKTHYSYILNPIFLEFYNRNKIEFDTILSNFNISISIDKPMKFEVHEFNSRANNSIKDKTAFIFSFFKLEENPYTKKNFELIKHQFPKEDMFVGEVAYFGLPFDLKESETQGLRYIGKKEHLLWQKERIINNIIRQLPSKYTNVAWIDGDVLFDTDNIAFEINKALKVKSIIQLFNTSETLDEEGNVFLRGKSFISSGKMTNTGYGWAARREEIEDVLLTEKGIFGSDDSISAVNFCGREHSTPTEILKKKLYGMDYIINDHFKKCQDNLSSGHGYLHLHVKHLYHKSFNTRKYTSREFPLFQYNYDPLTDLIDEEGELLKWVPNYRTEQLAEAFTRYICGE